jgi:hypothetical protein
MRFSGHQFHQFEVQDLVFCVKDTKGHAHARLNEPGRHGFFGPPEKFRMSVEFTIGGPKTVPFCSLTASGDNNNFREGSGCRLADTPK